MLALDILVFGLAHVSAYMIRFEFSLGELETQRMLTIIPLLIPLKTVVFIGFGLYRGMWRYASLNEMANLLKASIVSSLCLVAFILFVYHFKGYSRAVVIIDCGLTFLFAGFLRLSIRLFYQRQGLFNRFEKGEEKKKKRILIIGAGDAGEKALREIRDNPGLKYQVIAFLDDNREKHGQSIHGVTVSGGLESLYQVVEEKKIDEILIAIPSATGSRMRAIVNACEKTGIPFKTLPGLGELIGGKVSVKALRDVNYQDLLGRSPVELDSQGIAEYLKNVPVLITGAGGSIGSELCRQIARFFPSLMILLDASEANLYQIEMEFRHLVGFQNIVPILADIRSASIVEKVFNMYKPGVVFHAAAYKHVPMLQLNPWQAVYNNILGTQTVMEKAIAHGVNRFVLVSTDKAVRPTNIMGATKRVCELMMQAMQGDKPRMIAVRFGNVVGSSGSVIPVFREQIAIGGPVTVTHPQVTRYFMTIPEAAQLILQTGAQGMGGEIFILEMGTPVKIVDMARDLIRLSGKDPDKDIQIKFTGLRPGEKLYEELITEGEGIVRTDHEKILVLKHDGSWAGMGNQEAFRIWLQEGIRDLTDRADRLDAQGIRAKLKEMVPEYTAQPTESVFVIHRMGI